MIWQDWVFSLGAWVFVLAMIPTIRAKEKPALSTSLITGSILTIFALSYLTLSLWLSAVSTLLSAVTWFIVSYQKAFPSAAKKVTLRAISSALLLPEVDFLGKKC